MTIEQQILDSIAVKQQLLAPEYIQKIQEMAEVIIEAYKNGGKLLICGNGGSAADAQHIAAELVVRFRKNRGALAAIALTTNPSIVTAVGNDLGYDEVFARQVEAYGRAGDVLLAISTSGGSKNVQKALEAAEKLQMKTLGLYGCRGGSCIACTQLPFVVPSEDTPRIQESHILTGHIICEIVEEEMSRGL